MAAAASQTKPKPVPNYRESNWDTLISCSLNTAPSVAWVFVGATGRPTIGIAQSAAKLISLPVAHSPPGNHVDKAWMKDRASVNNRALACTLCQMNN